MLLPIEDTIRNRFIPATTDGRIYNEEELKLPSYLPSRYGGLAIPIFHEQAEFETLQLNIVGSMKRHRNRAETCPNKWRRP